MPLDEIKTGLPSDLTSQLMSTEMVYYFSFIAFKGGCGSSGQKENYWLALTDKRGIYKTKVAELKGKLENLVERDGDLPFNKISFIEVSEAKEAKGCSSSQQAFHLRL